MNKDFLFLSGRISALESKLVTFAQLERMVMAKDPEAAFRILVELQYADVFDDSTKAQDFLKIINQGLLETKEMIMDGTDSDESFEFIWKSFDLNNLKRALKIKFLDEETEITDFSEDNGFNWLGSFDQKDLQEIVFSEENSVEVPVEYQEALGKSREIFEKNENFQEVELALDKAHFDFLHRISKGKEVKFLKNWLEKMADTTNIKTAARNLLLFERKISREMFLPHGKVSFEDLESVDSIESAEELFKKYELYSLEGVFKSDDSAESNILNIERAMDRFIDDFLQIAKSDALGGLETPLVYLHRRIKNARKIKFVMMAKFYGMDPEKIYETLKNI